MKTMFKFEIKKKLIKFKYFYLYLIKKKKKYNFYNIKKLKKLFIKFWLFGYYDYCYILLNFITLNYGYSDMDGMPTQITKWKFNNQLKKTVSHRRNTNTFSSSFPSNYVDSIVKIYIYNKHIKEYIKLIEKKKIYF